LTDSSTNVPQNRPAAPRWRTPALIMAAACAIAMLGWMLVTAPEIPKAPGVEAGQVDEAASKAAAEKDDPGST